MTLLLDVLTVPKWIWWAWRRYRADRADMYLPERWLSERLRERTLE